MVIKSVLICCTFVLHAVLANAADITLTVQPIEPVANESFRLIFNADTPVDADPDFDTLESVVDILRRNQQTSIKWVNGKNSHTRTWVLDVIAQFPGVIEIPSIAFGQDRSEELEIEILAAPTTSGAAKPTAELLLEIEVDKNTPYVQEQVLLTARLLRSVELNEANLTDPTTASDAIIKRLGDDKTYHTTRGEKRYEVFERRYSIFPQTSGSVVIEPLRLTTQIVQSSRSRFDPFRQAVTTRRIDSNAITLHVKPIPSAYRGATWLPAKRLRLRDEWEPNEANIEAGEPLARTVVLWAEGLNAGQLPEVDVTLPSGLKSYPNQPQTSEQATNSGFNAVRQQKYAMIPGSDGDLVFPETTITWWNTETDELEIARLAERRFAVSKALAAQPNPTALDAPISPLTAADKHPPAPQPTWRDNSKLIGLVVFAFCGWLVTALAWWLRARSDRPKHLTTTSDSTSLSSNRARRDVIGACRANDPTATKNALISWGQATFSDPSLATLGRLRRLLEPALATEIGTLDAYLYGQQIGRWDSTAFRHAFENAPKPVTGPSPNSPPDALPPLHRLARR